MSQELSPGAGVSIKSEAFGDPGSPPVLLIMGAMASMLWWPEAFCRRLAARGRLVIRYDHRDTGLSTRSAPGAPDYSGDDLAADAFRVLDQYQLRAAHLVGMSMGGMLGQLDALRQPERVLSLTVISSSPLGAEEALPPPTAAYQAHAAQQASVDWSDRQQAIAAMIAEMRALAGIERPFDETAARRLIEADFDRSGGYASATNHFRVADGDGPAASIRDLRVPLLVIHGSADPLFPIAHGRALASAVKGAKLVTIEGGGHELHPADWDTIIEAVVAHTTASAH